MGSKYKSVLKAPLRYKLKYVHVVFLSVVQMVTFVKILTYLGEVFDGGTSAVVSMHESISVDIWSRL